MKSYMILKTELVGDLLLTGDSTHLTGVYFINGKHPVGSSRSGRLDPANPALRQAAEELKEYFAGARTTFRVPLSFAGTGLQEVVWQQIALIPYGETITYSELAQRVGAPDAVRAVGTATGQNPISIIVPCHRVMGKDGKLRGYGGGLDRKRKLLALETNVAGLKTLTRLRAA